jgi:hypothetical protein
MTSQVATLTVQPLIINIGAPSGTAASLILQVVENQSYKLQYLTELICVQVFPPPEVSCYQWINHTNFMIISGATLDVSGTIHATNGFVVLEDPNRNANSSRFYRLISWP